MRADYLPFSAFLYTLNFFSGHMYHFSFFPFTNWSYLGLWDQSLFFVSFFKKIIFIFKGRHILFMTWCDDSSQCNLCLIVQVI